MASNFLGIGTPVMIRNIRSGNEERYGAWVNSYDEQTGRHYVTKLNAAGSNRASPAVEVLSKALRFDDNTPAQDGEDYVIEAITGSTAEMTKAMSESAKIVQGFAAQLVTIQKDFEDKLHALHEKLDAVVQTIAAGTADPEFGQIIREAHHRAVPVLPKGVDVSGNIPAPVTQTEPKGELVAAGAPETAPRKRRPAAGGTN